MGSKQTRGTQSFRRDAYLSTTVDDVFSDDILLIIMSFLNSEENLHFLVKSCSRVCCRWRSLIQHQCGLRGILEGKKITPQLVKEWVTNGFFKHFNVQAFSLKSSTLRGDDISLICKSHTGKKLKELDVTCNKLDDKSLSIILSSMENLQVLRANHNNFSNEGLHKLTQSENMRYLRVLEVYGNKNILTKENVLGLCSSPYLRNLEDIDLGCARIGSDGAEAIANAFKLKHLKIFYTNIRDSGFMSIMNSPNMVNLELLNARSNHITNEGAKSLVNSPYVKNLTSLDLGYNPMGKESVRELFSSEALKHVKYLRMRSCKIDSSTTEALSTSQYLRNLTFLDLSENAIGPEGVHVLASSENVHNIRVLLLFSNRPAIGDEGLLAIGRSEQFYKLTLLNVSQNDITDTGINAFTNGNLKSLKQLDISYNYHTAAGENMLKSCGHLKDVEIVDEKRTDE